MRKPIENKGQRRRRVLKLIRIAVSIGVESDIDFTSIYQENEALVNLEQPFKLVIWVGNEIGL